MSTAQEGLVPPPARVAPADDLSPWLTFVFAVGCGALVANLYYAQALITVISPALGLHAGMAGLIVTVTQLGYAAGLVLLVSLADLVENRRLILLCVAGVVVGLVGVTLSQSALEFLIASFVVGCCAVAAQIIVPFASHLVSPERRGRAIGNVMGGLVAGIMLARPVANFIASGFGWRAVFGASAVLAVALGILFWIALPPRHPHSGLTYRKILASMWHLVRTEPVLRRRAMYQSIIFGTFNLFWTAVPLVLTRTFGFDQRGIALFALAGAGGALAAPIAGRLADRGLTRQATAAAMITVILAFVVAGFAVAAGVVTILALAAILLDAAAQTNQILSQRVIYGIVPEARGRINAVYMTSIFVSSALGSFLAGLTFSYGGWPLTAASGTLLGILVSLRFFTTRYGSHDAPALGASIVPEL
jgi:predicted MFS family arabinose efflux permease